MRITAALRLPALLCALAAPVSGCLTPYCFPKYEHISAIPLEDPGDVYAFRVDVIRRPYRFLLFCTGTEEERLQGLDVSKDNAIPPQTELSLSRGLGLVGRLINDDGGHVRHDLLVKLYRPGYEVVVVRPGTRADQIVWKRLRDRGDLARQLDELCVHARPGSASPQHREALLFILGEYEKLAKLEPADSALAKHLREKITALHELADL